MLVAEFDEAQLDAVTAASQGFTRVQYLALRLLR
jgi:hypothetical protein